MSKRRRAGGQRKQADTRFWGINAPAQASEDEAREAVQIQPSPDPFVVARSLGPAPLALESGAVERHLTAVYEEVVRAATALAAANGLLAPEE
ncbi:MAG: hypothetical protein J2P57_13410 [Acidimicrobiaceae bacterium]|nr:hypothetical protein [Acidimicrobiaceae bacterium]